MEPPRVASNYTLFWRKPWVGHSTLLRTRLWVVTQRYCLEKRLRQRLSGKHNWQHAVPQSTGHFRRPCEAISCDNVKAFSVRNPFVFYLSTMSNKKKKIQKSEVKISFKADELITAKNKTHAWSNSERNTYIMLSNISKGTAILHQEVASCGFGKLVRYNLNETLNDTVQTHIINRHWMKFQNNTWKRIKKKPLILRKKVC